ncbi:MAG: hypothetical protein KDK39_04635 [Leptospiraceae bacterium]|nr:hypothetical protein [Leptospiraceae bacterium]
MQRPVHRSFGLQSGLTGNAAGLLAGLTIGLCLVLHPDLPGQAKSSPAACRQAYQNQIRLIRQNPNHPLVSQLGASPAALQGSPPKDSDLVFCQRYYSPAHSACQARAASVEALASCYQQYAAEIRRGYADLKKNPIRSSNNSTTTTTVDTTNPDYQRDLEKEEVATNNVVISNAEFLQQPAVDVSDANCGAAYQHMLSILKKAPDLEGLDTRDQILQRWSSAGEQKRFTDRCVRVFTPQDLGCIKNAVDAEVLQACLLVIAG